MLSNDRLIELTFHCFYIVFEYSRFIKLPLNQNKLFLFLWLFIHQVFFFGVQCDSSETTFKLFIFALFCLLLTCVYHIHLISVHLPWILSLGVIVNLQWDVSKPDIQICFPCRFVEGHGEGASYCDCNCCNKYIDWIQRNSSSYSI